MLHTAFHHTPVLIMVPPSTHHVTWSAQRFCVPFITIVASVDWYPFAHTPRPYPSCLLVLLFSHTHTCKGACHNKAHTILLIAGCCSASLGVVQSNTHARARLFAIHFALDSHFA